MYLELQTISREMRFCDCLTVLSKSFVVLSEVEKNYFAQIGRPDYHKSFINFSVKFLSQSFSTESY